MKKILILVLTSGVLLTMFFTSCDTLPPGFSEFLNVSIDGTDFENTASYNFGLSDAEGSGKTTTLVLTNTHDAEITVSSLSIDDDINYAFSGADLPYTSAPGTSLEVSLTYSPMSSGVHPAVLSVTIDGAPTQFILNLNGEGNYAPKAVFGVTVEGAGDSNVNGFFERTGSHRSGNDQRPLYTKSGIVDYYCTTFPLDGYLYGIDTSLGTSFDPLYDCNDYSNFYMVPTTSGWNVGSSGISPAPTLTIHDITGLNAYSDEELTAAYLYSDAENDAEASSGADYQWYRSPVQDGTYTAISGATLETYTPAADAGYFLKVEITTYAVSGFTTGTAVMSSSTILISDPPQP